MILEFVIEYGDFDLYYFLFYNFLKLQCCNNYMINFYNKIQIFYIVVINDKISFLIEENVLVFYCKYKLR